MTAWRWFKTARTSRHRERNFRRGYVGNVNAAVEKLREKGENVLTAAKIALRESADIVVADAKSRCPVKTGKLRNSIKAERLMDGAVYELSADAENDGVAYGQFVEFSPKINKPFLYPALDANMETVKNKVKQAVQNAAGGD